MITIYYNRRSIRLQNYDYTDKGMYYITICTKNRENILSEIVTVGADDPVRPQIKNISKINIGNNNYIIKFTEIGIIVNRLWHIIPSIYKNIKLHEFIIMPNHIHGIFEISDYNGRTGSSAPT